MKPGELWDAFRRTGRVEDYLRYRGMDVFELSGREAKRRHDDRRPDYPGEQQYR